MSRFLPILALAAAAAAQEYDVLLKGGRVIDPKNGLDQPMDVAVRGGVIAAVARDIDAARARETLRVDGLIVTPGLVDLHVHVFHSTGIPGAWAGDSSV